MKKISRTLWIFLILGSVVPLVKSFSCPTSKKCVCYHSQDDYELQCPPGGDQYVIFMLPDQIVKMECASGVTKYDIDLMPDIYMGDIEQFKIRYCPLPDVNFKETMEKFNITAVKYLHLEHTSDSGVSNVSKELFEGLSMLEALSVNLFKANFDSDCLANLSNLIQLSLYSNDIYQIDHDMFKYTPILRYLDLSRNFISHLPDNLFENLSNLRVLHLWSNELTSLSKDTFIGLKELRSLELSYNKITYLNEDTFSELVELVNISLRSNKLNILSAKTFKNNKALSGVRLGLNPNLTLSDYVFANLKNLTNIYIDGSGLEVLPEHIFEGSVNLREIYLNNNRITDLPESVLKDLTKLNKLDLSYNKLGKLSDAIFRSLGDLEKLHLEHNNLIEINEPIFKNTKKLTFLNLSNNRITTIDVQSFKRLKKLTDLDLSYNQYKLYYGDDKIGLDPFDGCLELQNLQLSHNLIESFPENVILSKIKLKSVNLDYNQIQELRVASLTRGNLNVFLNNNNITHISFEDMDKYIAANIKTLDIYHNTEASTVVYISQNPIRCDCSNFDLIQYNNDRLDPAIKTVVDIRMGDLYCTKPDAFNHILVSRLKPYHIICPLKETNINDTCPKECFCEYRPYDKCIIVNCTKRNLTIPPVINITKTKLDNIEVHLEENALEIAPYKGIGYENVTRLFLSNNHIKKLTWIPQKVEKLALNGNALKNLDANIIHVLNDSTTLKNLTLYGNPWSCGCSSSSLQNYLRNHYKKVNLNDVVCEDHKPLIEKKELCKSSTTIAMAIAMPILAILCATAVVSALYFYYQKEIKVWLYAKNLCLWFVTEEELDKDKTYDIFISYSHKDEEFVIQNILPVLEEGPNPFKICIHVRDWVPGEFIATQVTKSVLDSRRTLVVLSENFLESVWGKMEFRTAHTQAINEGRARVVVIKYGKINENKLDDELKTYLKTNTYVEWGDPWFWNKLKYALPHSRTNKFYNNNQKHANIMLKIDDKFELVTSSPTIHVESTPPVMSLDPSLLKSHPLNFSSNNIATPPAEAPLIINK